MAAVQRKLVHKQFNSPMGLYSQQNVKETLDRELKAFGTDGIEVDEQIAKPLNLANSAVLRAVEEEDQMKCGYKRVAWPPVSEERIIREFTPQPQASAPLPTPTQQSPSQQHQQQHHQQHQQAPASAANASAPAQQQYRAPSFDNYSQQQQQQPQPQPQPQQQYQAPQYNQQLPPQQQYQPPQPQPQQQQQQQQPQWAHNQPPLQHQPQKQYQPQYQAPTNYPYQSDPQANLYNSYSQPQQQHPISQDQVDYQRQQQQQQQPLPQDYRGGSPGIITLRKEAPVTQQPAPVITSQPAAVSYQGGSNMRGDLKWPPPEYKVAAERENDDRRQLALGPVCRPRKVKRDYTTFFAKNALNSCYPSYKTPPGTQHMLA